ncbi:hypothetical protein D3C87_1469300 [compost metagenome]
MPGDHLSECQQEAHPDEGRRDDVGRAEGRLDMLLEQHAGNARRDRAQDHEPGETLVGIVGEIRLAQAAKPGPEHVADVRPEIPDDREKGPALEHHVIGQAGIAPVHEPGDEDEVGRAADGQELGDALHHPQHDGLKQIQRRVLSRAIQMTNGQTLGFYHKSGQKGRHDDASRLPGGTASARHLVGLSCREWA